MIREALARSIADHPRVLFFLLKIWLKGGLAMRSQPSSFVLVFGKSVRWDCLIPCRYLFS